MDPKTTAIYNEYLELTGDKSAAASLTLADAMHRQTAERPLTVPEVARHFRVSRNKVLAWIRSGRLHGYNVSANGRPKYRINPSDLDLLDETPVTPAPAAALAVAPFPTTIELCDGGVAARFVCPCAASVAAFPAASMNSA